MAMKLTTRYKKLSLWNKIGFWGAIASIVGLLITLGTSLLLHSGSQDDQQDGQFVEYIGEITSLPESGYLDVYYPVPFSRTPELNWIEEPAGYEMVEQRKDGFRIMFLTSFPGNDYYKYRVRGSVEK